jgi:hypothetical protein
MILKMVLEKVGVSRAVWQCEWKGFKKLVDLGIVGMYQINIQWNCKNQTKYWKRT